LQPTDDSAAEYKEYHCRQQQKSVLSIGHGCGSEGGDEQVRRIVYTVDEHGVHVCILINGDRAEK
jgi:hypothetical protein